MLDDISKPMTIIMAIDAYSKITETSSVFLTVLSDKNNIPSLNLMAVNPINEINMNMPTEILTAETMPRIGTPFDKENNMTVSVTGQGTMPAEIPTKRKFLFLNRVSDFISLAFNIFKPKKIKPIIVMSIPLAAMK
jgi:hypothetical protein